jgi:hypothetical protein
MTWRRLQSNEEQLITMPCTGSEQNAAPPGDGCVLDNKMKKFMLIFLISILYCVQVWAACGDTPEGDSNQKGVSIYQHAKTVYDSTEGNIKANDNLIVWNKDANELCFSITTVSNYFHNCSVEGKSTKVRNNEYGYTQNKCRVFLSFMKDKVKVTATGSRGNYCVAEDLGEDNGCGMNTSIDSVVYKVRKK